MASTPLSLLGRTRPGYEKYWPVSGSRQGSAIRNVSQRQLFNIMADNVNQAKTADQDITALRSAIVSGDHELLRLRADAMSFARELETKKQLSLQLLCASRVCSIPLTTARGAQSQRVHSVKPPPSSTAPTPTPTATPHGAVHQLPPMEAATRVSTNTLAAPAQSRGSATPRADPPTASAAPANDDRERIDMTGCGLVGLPGGMLVCAFPLRSSCTTLILASNPNLGIYGIDHVITSLWPSLRILDLTDVGLQGEIGGTWVGKVLLALPTLRSLSVYCNALSDDGLSATFNTLAATATLPLQSLDLGRVGLKEHAGGSAVAHVCSKLPHLDTLSLRGNTEFQGCGVGLILERLRALAHIDSTPKTIRTLDLSACGIIKHRGGDVIGKLAAYVQCVRLNVSDNALGDLGLQAIARELQMGGHMLNALQADTCDSTFFNGGTEKKLVCVRDKYE
eukprot:GEMP01031466.1.p1 GENE.GEMP01031466.1~~GEMP01031466.1.p1  ORF type:complete len:452 (+),score=89.28 GEMP01031466.1:132-1487(+)